MVVGRSKYYWYAIACAIFSTSLGAIRKIEDILGDRIPVGVRTIVADALVPLFMIGLLAAVLLFFVDALVTRSIVRIVVFGFLSICSLAVAAGAITILVTRSY